MISLDKKAPFRILCSVCLLLMMLGGPSQDLWAADGVEGAEVLFVPDELIVKFHPEATQREIDRLIAGCGVEVREETNKIFDSALASPNARIRELPPELAALSRNIFFLGVPGVQIPLTKEGTPVEGVPEKELSRRVQSALACFLDHGDLVEFAEANGIGYPDSHRQNNHPNDTEFAAGNQWSLLNAGQPYRGAAARGTIDADIDIMMAWDLPHNNCSNQVIGIIDSGLDLTHPDLVLNLWQNAQEAAGTAGVDDDGNGFVDDINGWNFAGGGAPQDTAGHGTGVGGIIGARGNNRLPPPGYNGGIAGICWQTRLMALRVLNPTTTAARVQMAAAYAVAQRTVYGQNLRVVNMSISFPSAQAALQTAVNQLQTAGILLVATPGNGGQNMDVNPRYPCAYGNANLLCVAASDNQDLLRANSGFGPIAVDLAAPGERITTLNTGGGIQVISGTSFAAPHVTGVIALAMSLFPAKTNAQIVADILNGAVGPQPASGVDVVKPTAARTINGNVVSNGRLRWPYAADLGDAPDSYATIAATSRGALHWDIGNEYFGDDVTPEVDANTPGNLDQDPTANILPAPNMDFADEPIPPGNGGFFFNPAPPWQPNQPVTVFYTICSDHFGIADSDGGRYQGNTLDRAIFVNGWFDLNQSGTFENTELLLEDIHSPPPGQAPPPKPGFPNVTINTFPTLPAPGAAPVFPPNRTCRPYLSSFVVPAPGGTPAWVRFRLDYGEDVGFNTNLALFRSDTNDPPAQHRGRVKHGDVEDFDLQEMDYFEDTTATVTVGTSAGDFQFDLAGPTAVDVDLTAIADYDGDGLDEAPAKMVQVELTGDSQFGPVIVRLRDPELPPFQSSGGFIEETVNRTPGVLDLPPFDHMGTAQSSFDVYFELELPDLGLTLHNEDPKKMETEIKHKPPCEDEVYEGGEPVALYDEDGGFSGVTVEISEHTPKGPKPKIPPYCHPEKMTLEFPGRKLFIEELCHPLKPGKAIPAQVAFDPDPGFECMDSSLEFYASLDEDGFAKEHIVLTGPVCIERSAPYVDPQDGLRTIDTQMVHLEMQGRSELVGEITVTLANGKVSRGQIKQSPEAAELEMDISPVTPAESWFDVTFVIENETLGTSEVTTSQVTAEIVSVPPGRILDPGSIGVKPGGVKPGGVEPGVIEH